MSKVNTNIHPSEQLNKDFFTALVATSFIGNIAAFVTLVTFMVYLSAA